MLESRTYNNTTVLKIINTDKLNMSVVMKIKNQVNEFFNKENKKVVLDMSNINFIDSSGFTLFISALKTSRNTGKDFVICNMNTNLIKLVELMKLQTILNIKDNLETALD